MVIFGQLCTFGINDYVLKNTASASNDQDRKNILSNSLQNLIIILIFFYFLFLIFVDYIGYYFNSNYISENLRFFPILIIIFTINKIFFSYLNGSRRFKEFAFFNALRPAIILINLIIFIKLKYILGNIIYLFLIT